VAGRLDAYDYDQRMAAGERYNEMQALRMNRLTSLEAEEKAEKREKARSMFLAERKRSCDHGRN